MRKLKKIIAICMVLTGVTLLLGSFLLNYVQYSEREKLTQAFYEGERHTQLQDVADGNTGSIAKVPAEKSNQQSISSCKEVTESAVSIAKKKRKNKKRKLAADVLFILRIPKIDSSNPVKEGATKEAMATALGHETTTVMPGTVGNCVIAGHRNYSFGRYFNRLNELEKGDDIYIDTRETTYHYVVTEVKTVRPDQVEILESDDIEKVTLYTCTPIYTATHRLVVVAERVADSNTKIK